MAASEPGAAPVPVAKLVLLGSHAVGKSCVLERLVKGTFSKFTIGATIGAAFAPHLLQKDGSPYVKLEIWDTAGQEQFQSLAPMYYRGAEGAVLMFDLTSARSFEAMKHWGEELGANGRDGVALVVCGNKCDLVERDPDSREVESEFAIAYADEIGAEYFETSALTDVNVHEAFMRVTDEIMSLRRAQAGDAPLASADPRDRHESIVLPDEDARMGSKPRGGKGCCS